MSVSLSSMPPSVIWGDTLHSIFTIDLQQAGLFASLVVIWVKSMNILVTLLGYSPIMLSLLLLFVLSSSCLFSTIYNHYSMSSARKVASISLLARNEVLWICTLLLLTPDTEEDTGAQKRTTYDFMVVHPQILTCALFQVY